ncbi:MAG TPA: ABC transporter permease [Chloroflexota bacterium]|jgi:peptide/nickel transport system permease protein
MAVRSAADVVSRPSIAPAAPTVKESPHPVTAAFKRTWRNPLGFFGLAILGLLVFAALTAPFISPYDPIVQHQGKELRGPTAEFWLGTDELGRDLLSRVIWGTRPSLIVAIMVIFIGGGIGICAGLAAGYLGGWVDALLMRVFDALFAFPPILLGFVVIAALGPGTTQVAYAIAIAVVPSLGRVARSLVLKERYRDYVLAARCIGARVGRVMFLHVLPNAISPMIVNIALIMGFSVLAEASLAFLGLGTQPPTPSWGAMLNASRAYLRVDPWMAICPGIVLALLLLGLNYLADALREAFDPRRVNAGF